MSESYVTGSTGAALASFFSNSRWVAEVDAFHSVIDRHSLH